jgi:hypothetical protein
MNNYNVFTVNTNKETGIPFGYISAQELDQDLVFELMYEVGNDESMDQAERDLACELGYDENRDGELGDFMDKHEDEFEELRLNWECDEPEIWGSYEGVQYSTSWLGGALNFYIFESPCITNSAAVCSPCVPNAGDLGSKGDYQCYDVPESWRCEEY